MPERTRTGNVLLDAWIDALTPAVATEPAAAADSAADAVKGPPSGFGWERLFFGGLPAAAAGASVPGPASAARLTEVWSDLAQRSLGVISALGNTAGAGDPLGEALEKSFGVMGDAGGALGEGPALLAEATKAAAVLYAARESYRAFMFATWQHALEEVTREAVERANEGKPVTTPAQWLSFSNAVADRVFVEAFHSQTYADAQSRLSSALAGQRRAEMKLVEAFARFGHFPTRRALDDVSQEVAELRRRVRSLERASRSAPKRRRKAEAGNDR